MRPGLLERLCDNRVARDTGAITYTQMLNAKGGIECDFTVTRLAEERFRIVTGTAFGRHDLAWIRQHAPDDGSVTVDDVTSKYACLGLWGPSAREILAPLTTDPLDFPYMRARELAVGTVPCLALRVTYVGELGWELYCPSEFGLALWDTIWEAGAEHGLVAGGYKAIDSLRLEKGYRVWGSDITADDTPYEAGLGFAVKLDKEFLGKEALVAAGEPERRLCCVTLADPRSIALGSEPVRVGRRARRPGDERRVRLHGRALDRVRVPPRRERASPGRRSRWRSSASGWAARSRPSRSTTRTELGFAARASSAGFDGSRQLGVGEGLVEQAARSQRDRVRRALRLLRAARHQHHRQVGQPLAQLVEELDAGHLRHDDIADDEVEPLLVEQLERMLCRRHPVRLVAAAPEDLDRQLPHHRLVVDDQDPAHATASAAGSRSSPPPVAATTASRPSVRTVSSIAPRESLRSSASTRSSTSEQLSSPGRRDHGRVAGGRQRDVVGRQHEVDESDRFGGRVAQRERPGGQLLEADERLQCAHDPGDLGAGALGQRDPIVQLRARLGVVEGELGRADQAHERVRDLVQRAPRQQAHCQK